MLAQLLRDRQPAVALTGAGISVPSGIPDFRSPGTGLWNKVNPMEVAHIDAFRRDPARFWHFYSQRLALLADKQPNPAHLALAQLERAGLIAAVITQNVDGLHRLAGSKEVVELHGSAARAVCLGCELRVDRERLAALAGADPDAVPRCPRCARPLKPDVVLFGELLEAERFSRAQLHCERAGLLLCVGSSLEVHPAAGLVELTAACGGEVAIITKGSTPYDSLATVRVDLDVVEAFGALIGLLGIDGAPAIR